ncbi:MAG: cytochrome c3 family protein [Planctomycetota bacterium]
MMDDKSAGTFVFPKWTNTIRPAVAALMAVAPMYLVLLVWYGASPRTLAVGYAPVQPVPYSHALHAGKLGLDCRYCHSTVERAAFAALPPTQTCMNCHLHILPDSPRLAAVRVSYETGLPLKWIKVHDLPQYVYFNHAAHLNGGVSCVSCHGRIDRMEVVSQTEPLSMGWCLECHRQPEQHLRPKEFVTKLGWVSSEDPAQLGARLRKENNINPRTDCSTCHR